MVKVSTFPTQCKKETFFLAYMNLGRFIATKDAKKM
jgi:hypothetical protein